MLPAGVPTLGPDYRSRKLTAIGKWYRGISRDSRKPSGPSSPECLRLLSERRSAESLRTTLVFRSLDREREKDSTNHAHLYRKTPVGIMTSQHTSQPLPPFGQRSVHSPLCLRTESAKPPAHALCLPAPLEGKLTRSTPATPMGEAKERKRLTPRRSRCSETSFPNSIKRVFSLLISRLNLAGSSFKASKTRGVCGS